MATTKSATLTFRSGVGLYKTLRTVANREYQSITNMAEMQIRERCYQIDIAIPKLNALFNENRQLTLEAPTGIQRLIADYGEEDSK